MLKKEKTTDFEDNVIDLRLASEKKRKKRSKFFYQVENHQELFKIGASYYKDYESGIRSFAIGSTGYQASQQKTIMGLASFFDHQKDLKIAIVTESLSNNYFSHIVENEESHEVYISDNLSFNVTTFHNHFDFILLDEFLINLRETEDSDDEREMIENFLESYDVVFWDVPEIYKLQASTQIYIGMLEKFESLTLIVAQSLSKKEEIDHMVSFFSDYGVTLKGLLMDEEES